MKIINAIHAQEVGGVDQVFRNYSEVLIKEGHQLSLLISDNGNDNYNFATGIFKLKNNSQISDFFNLLKIIFSTKPDIIICHSKRLMQWMKFVKIFNKIGLIKVKSVAVNHGITFKKSLNCDFVISINQQIANLVVEEGFDANKSFILPNVIKCDQDYKAKTIKSVPIIAIYGRIEHRKAFDILIESCGLLAKENYDFKLKIGGFEVDEKYGWNKIKEFLKIHNIADKSHLFGIVRDKKSFFEDVDIFCVPSREEPFGLVILESFLNSTLVISSNSDGGKLLINHDHDGLLFENGNCQDLADKIKIILENPSLASNITKNAHLKLSKEFSFDILGQKFTKILQQIVTITNRD